MNNDNSKAVFDINTLNTLNKTPFKAPSGAVKRHNQRIRSSIRNSELKALEARLALEFHQYEQERANEFRESWNELHYKDAQDMALFRYDAIVRLHRLEQDFFHWAKSTRVRLGSSSRRSRIFQHFVEDVLEAHYKGVEWMLSTFAGKEGIFFTTADELTTTTDQRALFLVIDENGFTEEGRNELLSLVSQDDDGTVLPRNDFCPICGVWWEDPHEDWCHV